MKPSKADIEVQSGTIHRIGEFRVHIKYGRGGANGSTCTARLWHPDGQVVGRATGGGYDMKGSALGDAIQLFFQAELRTFEEHDLDKARKHGVRSSLKWDGTSGKLKGIPMSVDGACGIETMLSLLTTLGFKARLFETGKDACMVLAERVST